MKVGKIQTIPIARAFSLHKRQVVEDNDRDHSNLLFYLDNWDNAIQARGPYSRPRELCHVPRPRRCTFVWEQHEGLHADVFVGETAC